MQIIVTTDCELKTALSVHNSQQALHWQESLPQESLTDRHVSNSKMLLADYHFGKRMDSQNAMCSETLVSFVKSFYVS
jgi:hypothetical protein